MMSYNSNSENVEIFLKNMLELKSQQKHFEKMTDITMSSLKTVLTSDFYNYRHELIKKKQYDNQTLIKHLKSLTTARKKLKKDVTDKNKLREFDLSYFKNSIAFIEKNISTLKNQISSETERLRFDENDINADLNKILSKNDLFETADDSRKVMIPKKLWKKPKKCDSKEISEFLDFVHEKGGHEGGWGVNDHCIFLKYYKQYEKDVITLIKVLSNFLPEKSDENIIEHVEWYMEYEDKREKYKNSIQNWRQNRNSIKQIIEINFTEKVQFAKEEKKFPQDDSQILKAKIREWKENKVKKVVEEKQKIVEKPVIQEKKFINENERSKVKMKIAKWKHSKTIEKQKHEEEQNYIKDLEKELRIIESKKLIKEFQDQDMHFIRRRQELKSVNKKYHPLRQRSLTVSNVVRDPDRLHRATKQWLAKTQRSTSELVSRNVQVLSVNHIPKLRKPEWIGVLPSILYH